MSDISFKHMGPRSADMVAYVRAMAPDNSGEVTRLKHCLARALQADVTPRQREELLLYYGDGKCVQEIADLLGLNKSTVSRTLRRGERRLRRCLKYCAPSFLYEE